MFGKARKILGKAHIIFGKAHKSNFFYFRSLNKKAIKKLLKKYSATELKLLKKSL